MFKIINPRQTILVTARGQADIIGQKITKEDIVTLDWHMPVSMDPSLYAIALGKSRFSLKLIKESGVFAVNFIPFSMKEEALFCGRNTGEHMDKFKETGLKKAECDKIDCPRLKDAAAYLECTVEETIEAGDHWIIIGKVLAQDLLSDDKRLFHTEGSCFARL